TVVKAGPSPVHSSGTGPLPWLSFSRVHATEDPSVLQRVVIKGFRSLRSIDVPLRPLTVLIGLNDTGKSSFLHALWKLGNQSPITAVTDRWRFADNHQVEIRGWDTRGQEGWVSTGQGQSPLASISPTNLYQPPSDGIPMSSPGYADEGGAQQLERNGL